MFWTFELIWLYSKVFLYACKKIYFLRERKTTRTCLHMYYICIVCFIVYEMLFVVCFCWMVLVDAGMSWKNLSSNFVLNINLLYDWIYWMKFKYTCTSIGFYVKGESIFIFYWDIV